MRPQQFVPILVATGLFSFGVALAQSQPTALTPPGATFGAAPLPGINTIPVSPAAAQPAVGATQQAVTSTMLEAPSVTATLALTSLTATPFVSPGAPAGTSDQVLIPLTPTTAAPGTGLFLPPATVTPALPFVPSTTGVPSLGPLPPATATTGPRSELFEERTEFDDLLDTARARGLTDTLVDGTVSEVQSATVAGGTESTLTGSARINTSLGAPSIQQTVVTPAPQVLFICPIGDFVGSAAGVCPNHGLTLNRIEKGPGELRIR